MEVSLALNDFISKIQNNDIFDCNLHEKLKYSQGKKNLKNRYKVPDNCFGQLNIICDDKTRDHKWMQVFIQLLKHFKIPHSVFENSNAEDYLSRISAMDKFRQDSTFREAHDFCIVPVFYNNSLLQPVSTFVNNQPGLIICPPSISASNIEKINQQLGILPIQVKVSNQNADNRIDMVFWKCYEFLQNNYEHCRPLYDRCSSSIFLLHGKGTYGAWQNKVQNYFVKEGFHVECGNYNFVRHASFFNPFRGLLKKKIVEISKAYKSFCKSADENKKFVIVHSLGSYIFAKSLNNRNVQIDKLILCGSILPEKMGSFLVRKVGNPNDIINEVGTADIWPAIATGKLYPYGNVGSFGFRNSGIKDRFHQGFGHSTILTQEYAEKYWLPFFDNNQYIEGDAEEANNSGLFRISSTIPLEIWILIIFSTIVIFSYIIFAFSGSVLMAMFVFFFLNVIFLTLT